MVSRLIFSSLIIALPLHSNMAYALSERIVGRFCFKDFAKIPPFQHNPIPVGCEIIDCCPGCPGAGPIEWRIQTNARLLQGAELRFEGLNASELKALKITGNAKLDGDRIIVGRGASRVTGLPASGSGKAVVGLLRPTMGKDFSALSPPQRAITRSTRRNPDSDAVEDDIRVQQYRSSFLVNSFQWRHVISLCREPKVPTPSTNDHLKLQNIVGSDNVVVMMDSRIAPEASSCNDDQVLRSTGDNDLGNVLASAGCNSEVSVFSTANAMAFDAPVTTWTDVTGEIHTTSLQPVINMPVSVWIANNVAATQAPNDVANANLLYSQNKIGVQFTATYNNVSGNATAVTTIGTASCGAIAAIQASAFYTANALNIYYVNGVYTGENCARTTPVGDGNISYLGTIANLATLAHEIGHAFGLRPAASGGHTNAVAGFGTNNIMWGGGLPTRNHFSLGQAFRMNTHTDTWGGTMLINDGLRPGPGRACPPLTTSNLCPALTRDWVRP